MPHLNDCRLTNQNINPLQKKFFNSMERYKIHSRLLFGLSPSHCAYLCLFVPVMSENLTCLLSMVFNGCSWES